MSDSGFCTINIEFEPDTLSGIFSVTIQTDNSIWDRLRQSAYSLSDETLVSQTTIRLPWPSALSLLREYSKYQENYNFRFQPDQSAKSQIDKFLIQYNSIKISQATSTLTLTESEIVEKLRSFGFTKRELKKFQIRDLQRLISFPNGANFSVPGAGKTTVTFALHLLVRNENTKLFVVGPKSSFPAWSEVIDECIEKNSPDWVKENFTVLTGGVDSIRQSLNSTAMRYIINYEQLISSSGLFINYLMQNNVHLVLDESHRMKGGLSVKRGIVLLNAATLPIRRDILSGTPMPQSAIDLKSQLDFLWPGTGLGQRISMGETPRSVIGNLYVRTTKKDLELPPVKRHFLKVPMGKGQTALYAVVRDETLRELSSFKYESGIDIVKARRSVMRILQLSSNPTLALNSILDNNTTISSGIVQQVLEDGPSPKMLAVRDLSRKLASIGNKTVIWSIFTDTIKQMERMLADLNPVVVNGSVPSGEITDIATREGRIHKFHTDPTCMVFIANPAAAGEGISLHHVCHDAIYLDRSYNTTHYLQSIDRIHRLGLPQNTETNIYIFQTITPQGLGCVDHSVSRRLAIKLRALQQLLDDEDIHQIALDEENADEPIDFEIEQQDIIDLIKELEGNISFDENNGV